MFWMFPRANAAVWLGLGLLAGLIVAGFWPSVPLHATATDKTEAFSMATGQVELGVEAVYFLDHLTGELHAYVLGSTVGGMGIQSHYMRNVAKDFDAGEKAKYLMATGLDDLAARAGRSSSILPSLSVVYVAEVTTGKAIAYYLPHNVTAHRSGTYNEGFLLPVCPAFPIRTPVAETTKPGRRSRSKEG
jgi:hypothetical protein